MKKQYKCDFCGGVYSEDNGYEECNSCREEVKKRELSLRVEETGELTILYGDFDGGYNELGHISDDGECNILNDSDLILNYEQWLRNGKKTSPNSVIWKGGEYIIVDYILKRIYQSGTTTSIYDFGSTIANDACSDVNIVRMKSGKAVLF